MKKKKIKKAVRKSRKKPVKKSIKKLNSKANNKPTRKLSKKELIEFRKIALKRKDAIMDDIKHISDDTLKKSQKEASGDISGYTYHMADVATDNYDREFSLGLASNERKSLYELEDALKRIEEGSFGICDNCKSPISKIRLKAVPSAHLCIKCQERLEKK